MEPERQPDDSPSPPPAALRPGRAPATSHGELNHIALTLFLEQGFDETTIDDIARAAGISRRTFFRYFATKNELPWGDFGLLLASMRARFAAMDPDLPMMEAVKRAVIEFNTFPDEEQTFHRGRMWLLLNVPSLNAYSTLKYADWRTVIAEFVASRRGERPQDLAPQVISWACLGVCLGAYERWIDGEYEDLPSLLDTSFSAVESIFSVSPTL